MKNIQIILNAILSKNIFDYILMDKDFKLINASEEVGRYLTNEPHVGDDVLSHLPELVGSEEEIQKVFMKKYSLFTLESVHKNNYYINLSIEYYDDSTAMILFHNITAVTIAKQGILQKSNETTLLYSMLQKILDSQSSLLFVINREGNVEFANQRYYEQFGDQGLKLYQYFDHDLQDYDALCTYLDNKEHHIAIGDDNFMLQGTRIEATYSLFTLSKVTKIVRENHSLQEEVKFDSLTGVYRKKAFDIKVQEMMKGSDLFALVVADIDNFKAVNDTYGHTVGDEVLQEFASILKGELRQHDLVARWGGEEFLFVLKAKNAEEAFRRADALRDRIANYSFREVKHLTVSMGLSWKSRCPCETLDSLLRRADRSLYDAKNQGKNKTALSPLVECEEICL
jgi:diguanylate cyclase (GGDEF)-like protein